MAISAKDVARINLAKKRVERAKRQALVPWKAGKASDKTFTALDFGQDKPVLTYADKAVVLSDNVKVRSMSDKLGQHGNAIAARVHTIEHTDRATGLVTRQVVYDCPESDGPITDPLHLADRPKTVKLRSKPSAFKRAQAASFSVLIIRK